MSSAELPLPRLLLHREIHGSTGPASHRSLYSSPRWIRDLDIVGELRGHNGCVNALQWSHDGTLLATGSDDMCINIYRADAGFTLNTQIETGHRANIFNVKFMPGSGNRTVVTAAGDSQVRVFDVEYAPTTYGSLSERPRDTVLARPTHPRLGVRYARNPAPGKVHSTPYRVYKPHVSAVKKIVTEQNPWLFLTCSEDGTVRQFDLRKDGEFYGDGVQRTRELRNGARVVYREVDEGGNSPPLISYKRQGIELYGMSCSQSQPWYIALGGTHPYVFLHDRRMLGRDLAAESGQTGATRCVKRFGPSRPGGRDISDAHITGLKISDANPNELVINWSGDTAYLFDINRSPDANDPSPGRVPWDEDGGRRKNRRHSSTAEGAGRKRPRRNSVRSTASSELDTILPGQRNRSLGALMNELKEEFIGLASAKDHVTGNVDPELLPDVWNTSLRLAYILFKRINAAICRLDEQDRRYLATLPDAPAYSPERQHRAQMARNRRKARTFVMAAGCVARALGARISHTAHPDTMFTTISTHEGETVFRYRFINCILNYLSRGLDGIKEAAHEYQLESEEPTEGVYGGVYIRRIITVQGEISAYFDDMARGASPSPLVGEVTFWGGEEEMVRDFRAHILDCLRTGESRNDDEAKLFWGQKVCRALLKNEAESLDYTFMDRNFSVSDHVPVWERELAEASVGGVGSVTTRDNAESDAENGEDTMPDLETLPTDRPAGSETAEGSQTGPSSPIVVSPPPARSSRSPSAASAGDAAENEAAHRHAATTLEGWEHDDWMTSSERSEHDDEDDEHDDGQDDSHDYHHIFPTDDDDLSDGDDDDQDMDDDEDENDDFDGFDEDDYDYDDGDFGAEEFFGNPALARYFAGEFIGGGGGRRRERPPPHTDVPVAEHVKAYRGHCNVKTVKDVGFFGKDDEYIWSGSDCGHLFIWDKKTTNLVQLLHADDDIVNVAAQHPREPLFAVSGIDSTVKLFSPDRQMQEEFELYEISEGRTDGDLRDGGQGDDMEYAGEASRRAWRMRGRIIGRNEVRAREGMVGDPDAEIQIVGTEMGFQEWLALWGG